MELLGGPARRSIGSSAGAIVYSPEAEIIQPIRKMTTHTKASVNSISLPRERAGAVWPSSMSGHDAPGCAPSSRPGRACGGPRVGARTAGEIARVQAAGDDHRGERDREHEHRPRQANAAVGLLFRYAIERAEYRPRKIAPKGTPINVEGGQFYCTWLSVAEETGLSVKQVRRGVTKLSKTGMLSGRSRA